MPLLRHRPCSGRTNRGLVPRRRGEGVLSLVFLLVFLVRGRTSSHGSGSSAEYVLQVEMPRGHYVPCWLGGGLSMHFSCCWPSVGPSLPLPTYVHDCGPGRVRPRCPGLARAWMSVSNSTTMQMLLPSKKNAKQWHLACRLT